MAISRDHRRSLISAPIQTAVGAGSSLLSVYYLVRAGGLDLLGLWSIGNLAILYGSAMALGVHQVVARDLAKEQMGEGLAGLTNYARLIWCFMTLLGGALLVLGLASPAIRETAFASLILVAATGLWIHAILAKGPILYLRRFSENNIVEAVSALVSVAATVGLVFAFGGHSWVVWLPFLLRSVVLLAGLLLLMRDQPSLVRAFLPALPNWRALKALLKRAYGMAILWLASSSRMIVLRTVVGAFLGTTALGLLDVSTRVPVLLVNGVSAGNQTLLVELSAAMNTSGSAERVSQLLGGLAKVVILLNMPLIALYCAYADIFLRILVGPDVAVLRTLTWIASAWIAVTAVNQLAYWAVQSAGKEVAQATAYISHTVLFAGLAVLAIWWGAANAISLLSIFAVAGAIAETCVLWCVATSLPDFSAFLRSRTFAYAVVGTVALVAGTVIGCYLYLGIENATLALVLPAGAIGTAWLLAVALLSRDQGRPLMVWRRRN